MSNALREFQRHQRERVSPSTTFIGHMVPARIVLVAALLPITPIPHITPSVSPAKVNANNISRFHLFTCHRSHIPHYLRSPRYISSNA